jgi:hypothetical protein
MEAILLGLWNKEATYAGQRELDLDYVHLINLSKSRRIS